MSDTTRVELHCHSNYSDGLLSPREVAEQLAADGVAFASLTDHDSVEGLPGFRHALSRLGIGFLPGVEITAQLNGREAHILGYGIDPSHPELQATLFSLRRVRTPAGESIRHSAQAGAGSGDGTSAAPTGRISAADAIALIHRAGGKAFLAHPRTLEPDPERLREVVQGLQEAGLDGVEGIYAPHPAEDNRRVCELAEKLGLLVSAGSDAHDRRARLGVAMPTELWKRFRDAVCCGPGAETGEFAPPRHRMKRRHFFFHVLFPTLLALALFIVTLFGVFLPAFGRSLLERKREMIRELTNAAWSILAGYEQDERAGLLSRAEAQALAIEEIERLRYGLEGKDYFWVQDMRPTMIMHPYLPELNGRDVSTFEDRRGVRIFVEFADLVRRQGEGYVDYVWQWKDDPHRLAPKESYIKGFKPWGWIIGTGIYIEDVQGEIARVERSLVNASLGITAVLVALLLYVMRRTLRIERLRSEAEEGLRESTRRYRSLVEATTEGTLLVLDGRCRYANPIMLRLLGCSEQELELLDLADVLPPGGANEAAWGILERALVGEEPAEGFEGVLRRRDGALIECVLGVSRVGFAGRGELILLAKPVGAVPGLERGEAPARAQSVPHLEQLSEALPAGVFRARATAQGTVLACTAAAARLLRLLHTGPGDVPLALAGLFPDAAGWQEFLGELQRDGAAERRLHVSTDDPGTRTVALRAVPVTEEGGRVRFLDAVVEDVTADDRRGAEREALIERLQASMLFLHEPISQVARSAVFCPLDASVQAATAVMTSAGASAVLVQSESGEPIGIFTDRDLRARVVSGRRDLDQPVSRVMSSPLVRAPQRSAVYEALALMEEEGVQHLAVEDESGQVTGVVQIRDLLGFPNYGPIVLAREVSQGATADAVVSAARRAPGLAKALLDSGGHPHRVTRMITSVCDAATERFIALAQERLGPPPVAFAFLGLGSQGRQEQALSSDQDNAIVYADEADDPEVATYFRELGSLVCGWLDQAGYPYCPGGIMAQNPKWCRPLSVWQQYFSGWIQRAEPEEVRQFSIFFDFRAIWGEAGLADELRSHVYEQAVAHRPFLAQLAGDALQFKPPLRLFGRILVGGTGTDQSGMVNLKDALRPIVAFARLYALRHGVNETHTLDRLRALQQAGVLAAASHDETAAAYDILMRLRLRHQAAKLDADPVPGNVISYRQLGQAEETMLNQAFAQIAAVQRRISHDFLGDMPAT